MALQALHGHTAAFFWGNQYGGTGEVEVVAALFWVFGASATTLAATSSVLTAVAALLVGASARRLQPGRPLLAVAAAGAFWVWPEAAVLNSTREFGFRELTMVAGLAAILLVGRLLDTRARRDAAGLGFALGVGWWSSPEIGYFAIAAGVAVLLGLGHPRRRPPVAAWAVGAGTFALGALPWIWANARTGLASLHPASSPTYQASTYAGRLHLFAVDTLPMMLGLREPGDGRWVVGGAGPTLAVVAAVVVVGASAAGLAFARRPGREVHAGCCAATLAFPLAYSTFPATSFWLDGHYAVFLTPLLVLSVVGLVPARPVRLPGRVAVLAGVLGLATATTLVAFDRTELGGDPSPPVPPPDGVGGQPERGAHGAAHGERRLGAHPHGHPPVVGGLGQHASRLEGHRRHPLVDIAAPHHHLGPCEGVRVGAGHVDHDVRAVLGEEKRSTGPGGLLGGDDDRQLLQVDGDQLGGVHRRGVALGHDDGHRLADEADPVDGQAGPAEVGAGAVRRRGVLVQAGEGEVGGGPDAEDAACPLRLGGVDTGQSGAGRRRADEVGVQPTFRRQVGDEAGLAVQQGGVLATGDGVAEDADRHPPEPTDPPAAQWGLPLRLDPGRLVLGVRSSRSRPHGGGGGVPAVDRGPGLRRPRPVGRRGGRRQSRRGG
jgi:hypothetical protein